MLSPEAARANAEYIYYASPYDSVVNDEGYIEYLDSDYETIYDPDFNNEVADKNGEKVTYIEYMFNTFAYRDLSDSSRAKLNMLWEGLKVDSESFGGNIYIICAVILVLLIGFIVYKYVEKRKRRKLYWNSTSQPKVTVSRNDFNSTAMYETVKNELGNDTEKRIGFNEVNLTVSESNDKTYILKPE